MAKPTDTVKPWATSGNYPASIYPINLPWGAPNPVGGDPTPWSGQPSQNAADITAFAATGHTPQISTDASSQNRWNNTVYQHCDWVQDGTSAPDADAHVMETDGAGKSSALTYEATTSFQGVGATKAPLAVGATIPAGQEIELVGAANISGGAGSDVSVETTTITERRWVDSGLILPNGVGRTRWNDTFWSLHDSSGNVHTFDEPSRGYDAAFSTGNSIDSTTATTIRRVKQNEPVWVTISSRIEGSVASTNCNYRIQVTGPLGTVDILLDTYFFESKNHGNTLTETIEWVPNVTWPAELATQGYTFLFRMGVTSGIVTADRLSISVVSAWRI